MDRLENSIDARIRRASQRYRRSEVFVENPIGERLRVNVLSIDGDSEIKEVGPDSFFSQRRVFIMSDPEWKRVVAFVGDETFRNGGCFVETKNGVERKYKPDVPQAQETIAAGAARRVTATQIDGAA